MEAYGFTKNICDLLTAATVVDHETRVELLAKLNADEGLSALIDAFSNFIGMAVSVGENNAVHLTEVLTSQGFEIPAGQKVVVPTVFGAMSGYQMAAWAKSEKRCATCAYRLGSVANQCLETVCDAEYAGPFDELFMCHEDMKDGEPTRGCAGWAEAESAK